MITQENRFITFHLFKDHMVRNVFTTYQPANTQESIQKSHIINSLLMCLLFQLYVHILLSFSKFSLNDHCKS